MTLLNILLLILFINNVSSSGTLPFVCDKNSEFFDLKFPIDKDSCNEVLEYSVKNISLWIINKIKVKSILSRSIEKHCSIPATPSLLHNEKNPYGYIKDVTFANSHTLNYASINNILNLSNNKGNRYYKWIDKCKQSRISSNIYTEYMILDHMFYPNSSVLLKDIVITQNMDSIMLNCKDKLIYKNGICKYSIDSKEYIYVWDTSNVFANYNYMLPISHNYVNFYPYTLINNNLEIKIYKDYVIIPGHTNIYKINYNNANAIDDNMICLTELDDGICEYYITMVMNTRNTVDNSENTLKDIVSWINDFNQEESDSQTKIKKYNKIEDNDDNIYVDLNGKGVVYNFIFDSDILEYSSLHSSIINQNDNMNNIISNNFIICKNVNAYNRVLSALCLSNPYDCITAILGRNNIKVYKESNIYKIKGCTYVDNYEFKFEDKQYNNISCFRDIPIQYKIMNNTYSGFFNTLSGEIFSESQLTQDCPNKYYIELNNTLFVIENNIKKIHTGKVITMIDNSFNVNLTVHRDIIPEIEKIKNLPNLQNMKNFESTDEIFSNIIMESNVKTNNTYVMPSIDFSGFTNFISNIFSSWYSIGYIIIIIVVIFVGCTCLVYIKNICR
ncbi:unknown similar to AMEV045 [Adoxophyes honmai entomopoxvirus 'L']|uniref:Uncharacterized protein n=1 Tax=Adoxophyes honmai entomopoxvirus 'L' TaxID=1293540 RepID=A0A916P060_9POXV|nr:unknown similar to AMEV045 [Adoxophyes honmai entomopoxvirus 'L']CCU55366.1 unknown similar to AMEV045 [Adoxophyes honmai entomopoxvirus 'L']